MKTSIILSVLLFFSGFSASAQVDTLKLNSTKGKNSIITIKKRRDSALINTLLTDNSHSDTFRLPRIKGNILNFNDSVRGKFYSHLYSKLGLDSSNSDTLKNYIKKTSRDSIIVIKNQSGSVGGVGGGDGAGGVEGGDSVGGVGGGDGAGGVEGGDNVGGVGGGDEWEYWLPVGVALLALFAFLIIYFYKIANKEPIVKECSSEDILLDLKERLNVKTKSKDPNSISKDIIGLFEKKDQLYNGLEQELKRKTTSLQSELSEKSEKLKTLEMQIIDIERQNKSKDQLIEEQRGTIDALKCKNENVNEYGKQLLEIIYASLYKTLNDNRNIDPEKAKQLILKNTLICAFQSFSFFRINSGKYLEWDEMNRDIFFDKGTRYLHLITKNTPLNEVDPVAYYVMELLKDHGISVLDGVLVFGYKLGDHEKNT